MRKIIDIDESLIPKLKVLAAIESSSVKKIMEDAISWYVEHKQKEQMNSMSLEQKEDFGLLLLLQQAQNIKTVNEDELFNS
ncbi:hypothetical protein D1816_15680 [Aquimarina sp. AD10]|uniref:hypothetical protein n=1 Tax=Aquimarina sp. AD10 TaxID=1714849 RepID=UPI000E4D53E4|nr:hypothetical protein [Aquimarina sp. AD10]AXT61734.1 hypothetical protein D1816_15680 [Aquimarina sp. AD10]RKN00916.1 hypothetical protein D7033_06085 [Aquimarina sp. AD10]